MKKLIKIDNDVFFITQRLKEIDDSYEVYYNLQIRCYEVHSSKQSKNSFCFKVPYSSLDERTLQYALKTRSENRDKIIAEIEKYNLSLYEKNVKKQVNLLKEILCT